MLLTSYETVTADQAFIKQCVDALGAHGGRREFLARRDRLDVHIDGEAAVGGLPPLPSIPELGVTSRSQSAAAAAGDKRKRGAEDPFRHLVAARTRGGKFEGWGVVCVDEGHRLKNADSVLNETLTGPSFKYVRHRVVLTGTPIQNNLGELCAVLGWLHPGEQFDDEEAFVEKFGTLSAATATLRDEFTALLRPHILRRTKDDVLRTLPARHEVLVPVPLSAPQAGELARRG